MFLNKGVRQNFRTGYKLVKDDPNFSIKNSLKSRVIMLKGEKIVIHEGKYVISSFSPPIPSRAFTQQAQATPKKENIYTQQMNAQRTAPISFFLALTYNCNYNCDHCSAKGRKSENELNTEQWKSVIADLQEMGASVIGFTGGEPLLRKDLKEIISAVDDRSVTILYTNGKGLSYEKAKTFKENGLYAVGVSLDSIDEEYFNEFRKDKNAFQNSVDALQNCRKAGLYTMMQSVLRKEDISKKFLFDLFKFGKKLNVHEIRILEPIRSGKLFYTDQRDESIFFDKQTREKLIQLQFKINRKLRFPKMTTFAHTESDDKYGCGAGTQHSYITPNGELLPCDFIPMSFGNVMEENVKELWKEMNEIIGLPKSGCFANKINDELQTYKGQVFPLEKSISKEISLKHQSKSFPKYYRAMQGK
jgi:MoaA/NifB/PqqE/SkfB family radical SAM enzyme